MVCVDTAGKCRPVRAWWRDYNGATVRNIGWVRAGCRTVACFLGAAERRTVRTDVSDVAAEQLADGRDEPFEWVAHRYHRDGSACRLPHDVATVDALKVGGQRAAADLVVVDELDVAVDRTHRRAGQALGCQVVGDVARGQRAEASQFAAVLTDRRLGPRLRAVAGRARLAKVLPEHRLRGRRHEPAVAATSLA